MGDILTYRQSALGAAEVMALFARLSAEIDNIADEAPEVYHLSGIFGGPGGTPVTLPKPVAATNEYVAVVTPLAAGDVGEIMVEKGTAVVTVKNTGVNATGGFDLAVYYVGALNVYGASAFHRWYVSPSPTITDHGDGAQTGSLKWVLNQIGAEARREVELPGNTIYPVATDVTVSGNVALRFQPGAVLEIAAGKTVNLSGVALDAGPWEIFSGAGNVSGVPKADFVRPEWFGARADDAAFDNAPAIGRATDCAGGKKRVRFLAGAYTVKSQVPLSVFRYQWEGERGERGANQVAVDAGYPATTLLYAPANPAVYMVERCSTTETNLRNGPFVHENLAFDMRSGGNGFRFGHEDVDADGVVDNPLASQRLTFGVRFGHCAFQGPSVSRASDAAGRLTRSGQVFVTLAKNFEAAFLYSSFTGGDTQIQMFGCDKPSILHCRSQLSHLPLFVMRHEGSGLGESGVLTVVDGLQVEGWTFGPAVVVGCQATISNSRFENGYDDASAGFGKKSLTDLYGVTCVADPLANEQEGGEVVRYLLTFKKDGADFDVSQVIYPYLTPLEIASADGANTLAVYPVAVSGATVKVDARCSVLTWSDAAASVTRVLGCGPIAGGGETGLVCSGVSIGTALSTPAFVYVAGLKPLAVVNVAEAWGRPNNMQSLVVGNRLKGVNYLDAQLTFANCSPLVLADPDHPLVHVANWRGGYGQGNYSASLRGKSGDLGTAIRRTRRAWAFSPRDAGTSVSNYHQVPFVRAPGQANSAESVWAWLKGASPAYFAVYDPTLPSVAGGFIRVRVRARAVSGTAAMTWNYAGVGSAAGATVTLGTEWSVTEQVIPVPASWTSATRTSATNAGLSFSGSGYYISAVTVEEVESQVRPWQAKTQAVSPVAVTVEDSGGGFHNYGATGATLFSLPAGAPGLRYTFCRIANQVVQVDPLGAENIRGGAAGKYLQLNVNGDNVTLEWVSTQWEIVAARGTPAFEA